MKTFLTEPISKLGHEDLRIVANSYSDADDIINLLGYKVATIGCLVSEFSDGSPELIYNTKYFKPVETVALCFLIDCQN